MEVSTTSPPVSVIIPTYNRAGFLSRAVDSVLSQQYPRFELIVVDDGSTDGTKAVLDSYGDRIRVITLPANRGPAAARNLGIQAARFELIAFLDSDDCFQPGKLALQAAAMEAHPESLISHTEEIWFRRGERLHPKKRHRKEGGDLFARSLELCVVGMSTVMARKELFARVGGFDESFPCCEDYELWLRCAVSHRFLLVAEPLTVKHGGRLDQVSVRYRVGMDRYRIRAIEKLLKRRDLTAEQRDLARRELARKCRIYGQGCIKHGRPDEGEIFLRKARELGSGPG